MAGHDLGALGKSLLSLEINTIAKAGITTAQMPPAPHALLDVPQVCWGALQRLGVDAGAYPAGPRRGRSTLPERRARGGCATDGGAGRGRAH